jgi:hypothetical protein
MPLSMYQALVPPSIRALTALAVILEKGAAHCEAKNIDPAILVTARLFPDMYPLSRQVQIAADIAKAGAARLAGQSPPSYEDTEKTFPELIARVRRTIDFLTTFREEQFAGAEDRMVVWKTRAREMSMRGAQYVQNWVHPNVYFHVTTAYNILRHNGVELAKKDYLGEPH